MAKFLGSIETRRVWYTNGFTHGQNPFSLGWLFVKLIFLALLRILELYILSRPWLLPNTNVIRHEIVGAQCLR